MSDEYADMGRENIFAPDDVSLLLHEVETKLENIWEENEANHVAWAMFEICIAKLVEKYGTFMTVQMMCNVLSSVASNGPAYETELAGGLH